MARGDVAAARAQAAAGSALADLLASRAGQRARSRVHAAQSTVDVDRRRRRNDHASPFSRSGTACFG